MIQCLRFWNKPMPISFCLKLSPLLAPTEKVWKSKSKESQCVNPKKRPKKEFLPHFQAKILMRYSLKKEEKPMWMGMRIMRVIFPAWKGVSKARLWGLLALLFEHSGILISKLSLPGRLKTQWTWQSLQQSHQLTQSRTQIRHSGKVDAKVHLKTDIRSTK